MEIVDVAKNLKAIDENSEFCFGIHESVKCSDKNCSFDLYIDLLKDVLDSDKCYHYRVICLISQSMKHQNVQHTKNRKGKCEKFDWSGSEDFKL